MSTRAYEDSLMDIAGALQYIREFPGEDGRNISGGAAFIPTLSSGKIFIKCVYQARNLLDVVVSFFGLDTPDQLSLPHMRNHLTALHSFLYNLQVTRACEGASRVCRVTGITNSTFDSIRVEIGDATTTRTITRAEYFRTKLGVPLKFPHLPSVEINKAIMLPMELLNVVPGQLLNSDLSQAQKEGGDGYRFSSP
ncbi:hypothetical protein DSO57_1020179 [Entomophthora muscae]|uniref:Uncharacterized protein n=1 Tax=Entomophthora muscae TaxID=34485 RepID=A0ACC2RUZ7_9FUNG|nr:hypothetical protein DSO57_1020179 [Entomophthora muscae]